MRAQPPSGSDEAGDGTGPGDGDGSDESGDRTGDSPSDADAGVRDESDASAAECADGFVVSDGVCKADPCGLLDCGAHGTCVESDGAASCVCDAGFAGEACDACAMGHEGADCASCADGFVASGDACITDVCVGVDCGAHGSCVDDEGSAACACAEGFTGAACDECATGWLAKNGGCVLEPFTQQYLKLWQDAAATETLRFDAEGRVLVSRVGLSSLSGEQRALVYGQNVQCLSATDVFGGPLPEQLASDWGLHGVRDVVGVFALSDDGRGVAVAAALQDPVRVAPRARARWMQVGHQLSLAARLHRKLCCTPLSTLSHARFTPDGECIDARGSAEASRVRAELREMVRALEQARADAAHGDEEPVFALWTLLARGAWILVDQFDQAGERHIVAAPCPGSASLRELSAQQEAIARAAGLGLSNKEIAAELRIPERAVDNQLRRALQKLGLPHRVSLVRLWSALERAGHVGD